MDWCAELGIHCDVSYQIGLPGDDYESIVRSIQWLENHNLKKRSFFSIAAIWPETALARKHGLSSDDYEPERDKKVWEKHGLYYYEPGNPQIEKYYSNCSGTFHFIDMKTAVRVKHYLIDAGFIRRFDDSASKRTTGLPAGSSLIQPLQGIRQAEYPVLSVCCPIIIPAFAKSLFAAPLTSQQTPPQSPGPAKTPPNQSSTEQFRVSALNPPIR